MVVQKWSSKVEKEVIVLVVKVVVKVVQKWSRPVPLVTQNR